MKEVHCIHSLSFVRTINWFDRPADPKFTFDMSYMTSESNYTIKSFWLNFNENPHFLSTMVCKHYSTSRRSKSVGLSCILLNWTHTALVVLVNSWTGTCSCVVYSIVNCYSSWPPIFVNTSWSDILCFWFTFLICSVWAKNQIWFRLPISIQKRLCTTKTGII